MLEVRDLAKSFGDNLIFEHVSFTVNPGDRLGLVGPNGCGKTTLLKIILGEIPPDGGRVSFSPADAQVGYLAQSLETAPGQTVGQVLKAAVAGLVEAEAQVHTLEAAMALASREKLPQLLLEYGRATAAYERSGGYQLKAHADAVLDGLGLRSLDQDTPAEILSGGQKTRLGLARLLLSALSAAGPSRPSLLLLDEPTNHLDLDALEWLERFLQRFQGAALIVSHDRTFLDRTVGSILELDLLTHTAREYPGNYTAYMQAKESEREKHWMAYKDQQEFIAQLEGTLAAKKGYARSIELGTIDFARRKIAKGIARRAVVQQRRLQRLLDSEERIDRPERAWEMKLEFVGTPPTGRDVLRLDGLAMGFGERMLFQDVTLSLRAGERICLLGPNGSGKTTLARLILGELPPRAGRVRLGAGVKVGYYAQQQENLDPETTPYEAIRAVAPLSQTEARTFLHYFLFGGDDAFVPVGRLSFGERARLVLARLVAQGCNFLVLDEPINHLDIPSRQRFEEAMHAYQGSILAIVHDRYFIGRFATSLWAIGAGTIRAFPDLEALRRDTQG